MKKILCAGLVVCDIPLRPVPRNLFDLDHATIEEPIYSTGGDAVNVSITLSKLGMQAFFSGLVGNDQNGDFILNRLTSLGVDTSGAARHPSLGTGVSYIIIEPEGERHFLTPGLINNEFSIEHIPPELIREVDLVYLGSAMSLRKMDQGGTVELFKKSHSLGKITAADVSGSKAGMGAYWRELLGPMLMETDIFLPSYQEAVDLTGRDDLAGIRDALSVYGIKLLIVKRGSLGCYITDFKNEWNIPTFTEFKAVDTTGAGDSFTGGFLCAHLLGWPPQNAGRFANAVASFNVTKVGATGGVPDFDTVYQYVREHNPPGTFTVNV
ncbi:MAG: carbohydrate kinase family protein [Treponema sp.]|jgi:sugar/nucleoside kinase (ribokinase family)|nr:carbohydrate kinase family protein [Treponema sp.]